MSDSVLKQEDPPKEHVLFEGMARVYDKTEADEYIEALREEIAKLTLLSDSQLANQERLTEELAILRSRYETVTRDKNLVMERACVLKTQREALRAELATERANQERLVGEKWIDCKQELPPTGRDVLILLGNAIVERGYYYSVGTPIDGWYWEGTRPDNVTHWMPLPDPPALPEATPAPKDTPTEPKSAPEEQK